MLNDEYDDFDLDGIDRDAKDYKPPVRPSQRREASKLTSLIERVLASNPAINTAQVRRILEHHRRSGSLPTTATFNRAFAHICRETRDRLKNGKPARPVCSAKRTAKAAAVGSDTGTQVDAVMPQRSPAPPAAATFGANKHPLETYGGNFGGKVFTHGPVIRDFFSAIEKRRDDTVLKSLALKVENDATSRARLAGLTPKDRSIFEAALALP